MDAATDQAIGTTLPAIMAGVTIETDSSELSTETGKRALRLNDDQLAAAQNLASLPLSPLPRCDDDHFEKSMRALAILPRKAEDDVRGELRFALYRRMIGHATKDAISFMVETALSELEWFPSPKQCLDILARWQRNDGEVQRRASAATMVRDEQRARFDDTLAAMERRELDQAAIDALPRRMRSIGAERGFLRLHDDGVYRARPVPHG